MACRVLLLLALPALATALTWSLAADKPQPEAKPAAKPQPSPADLLARRIDFGELEADTKLDDALVLLARRSDLAFDINEKAFADEMLEDIGSKALGAPVPKMKNVTVERVLYKLLARIPSPSGATFMVRRESVEITTGAAQIQEVWSAPVPNPNMPDELDKGAKREPQLPLINADFDRKPLAAALKELSRLSGMNVIVDVRVAEKAKVPVTARFLNTPLDTAVRTLTDMTDLKPFLLDNALYVTARDNADRLEEKERGPKLTIGGQPDELDARGPRRVGKGPLHGRPVHSDPGGLAQ